MSASGLLGLLVNVSAGPELQGLLSITLESLQVLSHEVALLRKENFELSQQINLLDYNLAGEELAPPPRQQASAQDHRVPRHRPAPCPLRAGAV